MSSNISRLEELESHIEAFQRSRLKAGKALWEIREDELYKERLHRNVEAYALDRYGFRSSRVTQLIRYARVVDYLEGKDVETPENEAQARYLGTEFLDEDHEDEMVNAWKLALDRHGQSNLSMGKVKDAIEDYLAANQDDDEEPDRSEVDLKVPTETAEKLGLSGDDYWGDRVVPWPDVTRSELQEIIEETEPNAAPLQGGVEHELGTMVWMPLRDEEESYRLQTEPPKRIEFRPDEVQRLQESYVPGSNQGGLRATEETDALACPGVDLLSDDVPNPLKSEVLSRSGGTDWSPIFVSAHHERWTNHTLPDEAWIGATASRSSIEEVAGVLGSADDTEVKWALYDLGGTDRNEGLPDVDLSALDWIVISELNHPTIDLSVPEITRLRASAKELDVTLAVRGTFISKLERTP